MFGQKRDRIRAEQLVVSDRRGDRACAGPVGHQPGLRVVIAVAPCFEDVDADNLIARQARGERRLRVGTLEVEFTRRALWHEAELLGGVLEKVGDDWNIGSLRRRLRRCSRIDRARWP